MEAEESIPDSGDKYNINGSCSPSPPPLKESLEFNGSNIDDISTPSDLKFDEEFDFEDPDIIEKRKEIEKYLSNIDSVTLEEWQTLARSKGGLVSDDYRRKIWPLLVGVTPDELTDPPSLEELSTHNEYSQVVLDVGRSLKRFPPGVPYARRLALQDQLTVLILRVIIQFPHLKYYQGYHDVAITLLLVCGSRAAFPLLRRLSAGPAAPLEPFMQPTMEPTQHRLNYLLPLLQCARPQLAKIMLASQVGTMFALPWFLTWFGHSLPRYADVVRLYDFFLCAPPLMPVYVTAAIVIHREQEVLQCECDMATLHCLLSRLPAELPFEDMLSSGAALYARHPPVALRSAVSVLERGEAARRAADEAARARRAAARARAAWARACRARLRRLLAPRVLLAAAAALLGVWAYWRPELAWTR